MEYNKQKPLCVSCFHAGICKLEARLREIIDFMEGVHGPEIELRAEIKCNKYYGKELLKVKESLENGQRETEDQNE